MISKYLTILLFFISSAHAIECTSETRLKTNSNGIKVEYGKLDVVYKDAFLIKLSTDTEQTSFSVSITNEKITSIISLAPDYTVGTLVTGEFDKEGKFKHSLVGPDYTSILTCFN